ncbi:hypothetical protein [Mycobacterium neglectum]|uniref:hypothetical protein n=1 Tax=Mycobacterium neglectum TaxID=242737 RepID=UPI001FE78FE9|nr:hypothetical protein [Mycobacterium neglectum]
MRNVMKNVAAGTVIGGSLLFTAGLGIATAQPETAPDGLVNVSLGNAGILEDVKAADAAQIAAGVCDLEVDQVTTMAETTEADGTEQTVCTNSLGSVLIQQNAAVEGLPGQAEVLPGAVEGTTPGQSGDEVPTTEPATPAGPSAEQGS